jgi:serine-aspartate repeat-containing protein C/D/E
MRSRKPPACRAFPVDARAANDADAECDFRAKRYAKQYYDAAFLEHSYADAGCDAKTDSYSDLNLDRDAYSKARSDADADAGSDRDADAGSDRDADAGSDRDSDADSDRDSGSDPCPYVRNCLPERRAVVYSRHDRVR